MVPIGVRLFSDHDSDQSTCIYVDSSLNSSISSDLNSSDLNNSELNSSEFNSSSTRNCSFSSKERLSDNLKCYYTNADCLLNKIEELEVVISIENPDIIIVTEVFPKNLRSTNIDNNEYKFHGFSCFMGPVTDACGVAIFIKDGIKADYCYDLNKTIFKESVWCEITVDGKEKLLIGGMYKSPNCEVRNQEQLNRLITQAVEKGF